MHSYKASKIPLPLWESCWKEEHEKIQKLKKFLEEISNAPSAP